MIICTAAATLHVAAANNIKVCEGSLLYDLDFRPKSLTLKNKSTLSFPSLNHDFLASNDVQALAGLCKPLAGDGENGAVGLVGRKGLNIVGFIAAFIF